MSRVMRKPTFCICENKDADQLRGNREADQRLCFRCTDSTIPPLSKSEISSLKASSVAVQPGLCRTRSETRMLAFSRSGSNALSLSIKVILSPRSFIPLVKVKHITFDCQKLFKGLIAILAHLSRRLRSELI